MLTCVSSPFAPFAPITSAGGLSVTQASASGGPCSGGVIWVVAIRVGCGGKQVHGRPTRDFARRASCDFVIAGFAEDAKLVGKDSMVAVVSFIPKCAEVVEPAFIGGFDSGRGLNIYLVDLFEAAVGTADVGLLDLEGVEDESFDISPSLGHGRWDAVTGSGNKVVKCR